MIYYGRASTKFPCFKEKCILTILWEFFTLWMNETIISRNIYLCCIVSICHIWYHQDKKESGGGTARWQENANTTTTTITIWSWGVAAATSAQPSPQKNALERTNAGLTFWIKHWLDPTTSDTALIIFNSVQHLSLALHLLTTTRLLCLFVFNINSVISRPGVNYNYNCN